MKTYRVTKCFGLEYEHATIFFNVNTHWKNIGEHKGYIRMNRQNVYVDITREQLRNFFKQLKEQK